MPEQDRLEGDGGLPGAPGRAHEALDADAPRLVDWDRTAPRSIFYWFLFLLLFVGAFGPIRAAWSSGPSLHLALEVASTLLAFVVGALALVRFYSRRREALLFLGTGFLGTGLLDAYHVLLSTVFQQSRNPVELEDLASWSFTASSTFLAVSLFVSWLAWRQEKALEEDSEVKGFPAFGAAAFLTLVLLLVFTFLPPTRAVYPEWTIKQPAEFVPTFFFLLALAGYLGKGHWRYDAFEHWVVVGLIMGVMAHGGYMPFSNQPYDADFDAAHLLKMLSYAAVLVGVVTNVYLTFRREAEAANSTREANMALAREIDVRRSAEREIQASEERLQDFLDNAHDLIQSVDPEGRFIYVNRRWKETLGYTDQELKSLRLFDVLHEDCLEKCREEFARVIRGEDVTSMEVDFVASDGSVVRCSGSSNARIMDGKAVATRSIFRDMTEQIETQKELDASQANLQALVENTGDVIWSVDRELRLLTFNTAFSLALETRTGREPKIGASPEETFLPPDGEWYTERYRRCLAGEGFSETKDIELGGQLRSYEFYFNPIREYGGITGIAVFGKDVTSRRRTQIALRMAKEEAERANQAKSQFLANMSHELRTPLNSVIGFTNILLKKKSDVLGAQEVSFLDRISANGKHLLELINQVLDLAKIEAGRMELEISPVNLDELVDETLAQMEGQVGGKDVVLRADVAPDLDPIATDAGKLKQILINLIGNALQFTETGEVVVQVTAGLGLRKPAGIAVRDTGIGIPPDRLQAIFEAFQQADGTTSRRYGGTGLGLTISRSLCQLLGYDLRVESGVGRGSTFTVLLTDGGGFTSPSAGDNLLEEAGLWRSEVEDTPDHTVRNASNLDADGRLALLVEDNPDTQTVVREYLESVGFQVHVASNGEEAEQCVEELSPDAIFLDLAMPVMDGWSFLQRFRSEAGNDHVPVIILTERDLSRDERIRLQEHSQGIVAIRPGFEEGLWAALRNVIPTLTEGSATGEGSPAG